MTLHGFHFCTDCWGTGLIGPRGDRERCPSCRGAGQVPDDDTIEVNRRIAIEEPCEHGQAEQHRIDRGQIPGRETWCSGGRRRVLDPGSYVLIEKVDGEWPEWAKQAVAAATEWKAHAPRFEMHGYIIRRTVLDILDALAGGEG